ncbi:MAG: hypothetical protein HY900_21640 [Deltaproteobacteria bacterium]|nr:hypothetical protein [Deltaproteobacteria bacterium]
MRRRIVDWIAWFAWGAAGACLLATSTGALEPSATPPARNPTVLLITTTDDCQCTLDRCLVGRHEAEKFVRGNSTKFELRVVDIIKTPSVVRQYRVLYTPVALLLDRTGKTVARFETFFSESDLRQAWNQHLFKSKERKP